MDYGLKIKGSDGNQSRFPNIAFEQYIDRSKKSHIPITCSQQHLTFDNSIKASQQYLMGDNLQSNELSQYHPICSQNTYIDPRDSNNFSKYKRTSLRGRRRYRRSLLRNYEQSFETNINTNNSFLEVGDEAEINTQRRVFLRNSNLNGTGINHSNIKYNSNSDQYAKVSKPSWDGGRLVKLLQGHGLNIENYEKETETLLNRNWNSKQLSVSTKNTDIHTRIDKDTNNTYIRNEEALDQRKIYNNNERNITKIVNYNTINEQADYSTVNINNCTDKCVMSSRGTIQPNEVIQLNQSNYMKDTNSNKQYRHSVYYITNDNYRNHFIEKDQQISNSEFISSENKTIKHTHNNKHFVSFSQKDISLESSSNQPDIKSNYQQMSQIDERIALNIEIQNLFSANERGNESSIQFTLPPKFPFDTSHEELFVTLGNTPTSRTSYNISSLFIPNQDS
ncbi:hypothetical protein FG386_001246 [Cryptosporidium ryanae]|uniref:uncharacterized protein n=1 Tax=Cryptosporidium ryanae TaxID=515981 RepID=UPI003519F240|nr:hypothetical protein FG386_001246 [Cryptosporidium ryanae]